MQNAIRIILFFSNYGVSFGPLEVGYRATHADLWFQQTLWIVFSTIKTSSTSLMELDMVTLFMT
jgi:hypothetical protein